MAACQASSSGRVMAPLMALALVAMFASASALTNPLKPDFASPKPSSIRDPRHNPSWSSCGRIPRAISGILGSPDRTRDLEAKRPFFALQAGLANMAATYWGARPRNNKPALCAVVWLKKWATSNALLTTTAYNIPGRATVKFLLSSVALSWARMRDDPDIPPADKKIVEDWLLKVGRNIVWDEYANGRLRNAVSNGIYVAGACSAAVAIATDDQGLYDWAVSKPFDVFRAQVNLRPAKDGILPGDLAGRSTISRHGTAAGALTLIAYIAKANGRDLAADGFLKKLNDQIIRNWNDPKAIEPFARAVQSPNLKATCPMNGQPCERDFSCTGANILTCEVAYLSIYTKIIPSGNDEFRAVKRVIDASRPCTRHFLGMYTTYYYAPPR